MELARPESDDAGFSYVGPAMSEETAKALTEAMNRLAGVLERVSPGMGSVGGGLHIYHHASPVQAQQPYWNQTWGNTCTTS